MVDGTNILKKMKWYNYKQLTYPKWHAYPDMTCHKLKIKMFKTTITIE